MKIRKYLTVGVITALTFTGAFAQELNSDNFGSEDFSFNDFSFDEIGGEASSTNKVEISGDITAKNRAYISGDDDFCDLPMNADVNADVNLKYSGNSTDAVLNLKLNKDNVCNNPQKIIDEAYVSAYFGNFKFDVGQMKTVWGKGDKLHVIDNFNADDYSDFIIPDYIDRRISTPMVKTSYAFEYSGNLLSNMKIEGIYTPFLPTDAFATTGIWTPAQVRGLMESVTTKAKLNLSAKVEQLEKVRMTANTILPIAEKANAGDATALTQLATLAGGAENIPAFVQKVKDDLTNANTAYILALNNASALSNNSEMIYPSINTLEYGQAGTRFTFSLGAVDLGLSYYYGHYKQPSVNPTKIDTYLEKYLVDEKITESDKFLKYDQKQTFGLEFASIIWHFNVRGEVCYNLTDDIDGTDPWTHNNSVQWLGGFDIDLPFWNMNVNIQETGTYILKNSEIADNATKLFDVDYNKNSYMNNKIVANITTSFKNDMILPEVTIMYGIENGDLVLLPKIEVKPTSDLSLVASGMYIWCKDDNSEFASWKDNSFVQLGVKITF